MLLGGNLSIENVGDAGSSLTNLTIAGFANAFSLSSSSGLSTLIGNGVTGSGPDIASFVFSFDSTGKAAGIYTSLITVSSNAGSLQYTLRAEVLAPPIAAAVPVPATLALVGLGLVGLGVRQGSRARRQLM